MKNKIYLMVFTIFVALQCMSKTLEAMNSREAGPSASQGSHEIRHKMISDDEFNQMKKEIEIQISETSLILANPRYTPKQLKGLDLRKKLLENTLASLIEMFEECKQVEKKYQLIQEQKAKKQGELKQLDDKKTALKKEIENNQKEILALKVEEERSGREFDAQIEKSKNDMMSKAETSLNAVGFTLLGENIVRSGQDPHFSKKIKEIEESSERNLNRFKEIAQQEKAQFDQILEKACRFLGEDKEECEQLWKELEQVREKLATEKNTSQSVLEYVLPNLANFIDHQVDLRETKQELAALDAEIQRLSLNNAASEKWILNNTSLLHEELGRVTQTHAENQRAVDILNQYLAEIKDKTENL